MKCKDCAYCVDDGPYVGMRCEITLPRWLEMQLSSEDDWDRRTNAESGCDLGQAREEKP